MGMSACQPDLQDAVRAEAALAAAMGCREAVLVGSGTTALYVVFRALGLGAAHRVLYPSVTCETAVNAAIFAGCKPVFADCAPGRVVMDGAAAARASDCDAIVATHLFGQLCPVAEDPRVVEDAAQAFGGLVERRAVGTLGRVAIVSFGPDKLVPAGGGAVLTDDAALARECRAVAARLGTDPQGRQRRRDALMVALMRWQRARGPATDRRALLRDHADGYLAAYDPSGAGALREALGRLDAIASARHDRARALLDALATVPGIEPVLPGPGDRVAPWRLSFLVPESSRDRVYESLVEAGYGVTRFFEPQHRAFGLADGGFPEASRLARRILNLRFDGDRAERPMAALVERLKEACGE